MKIGYMTLFDNLESAESEAKLRYTYCLEKLGHQVVSLDSKYLLNNESVSDLDLVLTQDVVIKKQSIVPDTFSIFMFWTPSVFFGINDSIGNVAYMDKCDLVTCGYESEHALSDVNANPSNKYKELLLLPPSIPLDFCIAPVKRDTYKFFYVGMYRRYENLLKSLDSKGLLELYGPTTNAFQKDKKGPWHDFKSYKGPIKFDGKEIIKAMSSAGIVLAFQGKSHTQQGFVSNRIFEAAAAGAIIIASKNAFTEKYFGDSVFYVDINKSEVEIEKQIKDHLDYIMSHPKEAYKMAERAQNIFKEHLVLDKCIQNALDYYEKEKVRQENAYNSVGNIDVVCNVSSLEDYQSIESCLKRQIFKNYHLIICAKKELIDIISKQKIKFKHDFIITDKFNGNMMKKCIPYITGKYFMFMDGNSVIHRNHTYKLINLLENTDSLFVYSGSYKGKDPILNSPLDFQTIISDISDYHTGVMYQHVDNLANRFVLPSVMFKSEILQNEHNDNLLQGFYDSNLHFYFVIKCLLKNPDRNHFLYNMSVHCIKDVNQEFYYDCNNNTFPFYIYDIKKILLHFGVQAHERQNNLIKKPLIISPEEEKIISYIMGKKLLKRVLSILSRKRKKQVNNKSEQILLYLRKHKKYTKIIKILGDIK